MELRPEIVGRPQSSKIILDISLNFILWWPSFKWIPYTREISGLRGKGRRKLGGVDRGSETRLGVWSFKGRDNGFLLDWMCDAREKSWGWYLRILSWVSERMEVKVPFTEMGKTRGRILVGWMLSILFWETLSLTCLLDSGYCIESWI